ncbi:MAG: M48 family metallopeptidase, partial [Deltaproteobacteria bacterium]|nr:M48 family metallopeptidase [Deltaproteobacteria bacterium]
WGLVPRREPFTPPGPALPPEHAAALLATVAEVARASALPAPRDVYLVPQANAFIGERRVGLGLVRREFVGIGLGLLVVLDADGLRSVLAHELGHRKAGDVRLGPWVYRTRRALAGTMERLGDASILHLPFLWYSRWFLAVSALVSRQQEFAADAHAARVVSAAHAARALRVVGHEGALWNVYWRQEVVPVLELGFMPPVLEGFAPFCRAARERGGPPGGPPVEPAGATDTHPPDHERITALGSPPPAEPGSPAMSLASCPDALVEAAARGLFADPVPALVRVRWQDVGERVWLPRWQAELGPWAERLGPGCLVELPELLASPSRLAALFSARGPRVLSPMAEARRHRDLLAYALGVHLAAAGWRVTTSPGEPLRFVRGGESIDVRALVHGSDWSGWRERLAGWLAPSD